MDFSTNGSTDGGLRFRGSTSTAPHPPQKQQQQQQQRPPPPKASMSMGYMPVLMDESLFLDDKKRDPAKNTTSPAVIAKAATTTSTATTALTITTTTFPTASSTTTTISTNATDASRWVLITGYVTKAHYDVIRRRFAAVGNVLHTRGVCQEGRSNWYAVQYETRLEAEQALSLGTFLLVDGIWISVNRISPQLLASLDTSNNDSNHSSSGTLFPQLTTTTLETGTTHHWGLLEAQPRPARLDFSASSNDNLVPPYKKKTWDESEIYLTHRSIPNKNQVSSKITGGSVSMCDKIMNWIFGWDNYES